MRFKNRYLLLEFRFSSEKDRRQAYTSLTEKLLSQQVKQAIMSLHGNYGLACVLHSLNVKYFNVTTDMAVLRVPRSHYREVWSAISTITSLNKTPCSINILYIGGTIKCCQKKLINYDYDRLKAMIDSTTTPVERKKLKIKIKEIIKKENTCFQN